MKKIQIKLILVIFIVVLLLTNSCTIKEVDNQENKSQVNTYSDSIDNYSIAYEYKDRYEWMIFFYGSKTHIPEFDSVH